MLNRINKIVLFLLLSMLLIACGRNNLANDVVIWGKSVCYDDFLWKKYVPDTICRNIIFDFNDDAKKYMNGNLVLGLYKKNDNGGMVKVDESEAEVYVNGKKAAGNEVIVTKHDESMKIGVVFNAKAENKMHYWYFKPVSDGGLDRINNLSTNEYRNANVALMSVRVEKKHVSNPLKVLVVTILLIIIVLLLLWLLLIKYIFFPVFKVAAVTLRDPAPYMRMINIRRCRMLVLTSKAKPQSKLNALFTGKIRYEVNPNWVSDIVIEPRDRSSVRLRNDKEYDVIAHVLKKNQEYEIIRKNGNIKTYIKIS